MLYVRQEQEAGAKACWISFYWWPRVSRTSRKPWAVRHSCASHSTAQQSNSSGLRAAQRNGFFHVTPGCMGSIAHRIGRTPRSSTACVCARPQWLLCTALACRSHATPPSERDVSFSGYPRFHTPRDPSNVNRHTRARSLACYGRTHGNVPESAARRTPGINIEGASICRIPHCYV